MKKIANPSAELRMEVQLNVIDHLGLKMYTSLPPVISELIANCWDAEAQKVEVSLPESSIDENSEIIVKDDGIGMTFEGINLAYLQIGRNRREEENTDITPNLKRRVMGSKGIGKLSAFGVAKEVEIETVKDGEKVVFLMNIDEIRATASRGVYKPPWNSERSDRPNGTTVKLRKLSRKRAIGIGTIRKRIARRFSVIDKDFQVYINGSEITPEERDLKSQVEFIWQIDEKITDERDWTIKGWIGTMRDPISEEIGNGVVIMARGKLVQEPTLFGVSGGKDIVNPYIIGEIHAEFLDAEKDLIATYRASVVWESEEGQALQSWGQRTVRHISYDWSKKRAERKEEVIREDPEFKEWLEHLSRPEKKLANKVIRSITADETLPKERTLELAGFMKESFEYQAFQDLVNELDNEPSPTDTMLIELFKEWGIIEAKEILRVAKGRIATIEKLERFIIENAREVPEIHKFFAKYPWILDPSWTIAYDETYYSKLLREEFPDDKLEEPNRRIDFVCLGAGDTIHVVELKRPGRKITIEDLQQLERYVAFVRHRLGNVPERSYGGAAGYIVAGEIQDHYEVADKIKTLRGSRMYVKKYEDLLSMAKKLHDEFIKKFESLKKLL